MLTLLLGFFGKAWSLLKVAITLPLWLLAAACVAALAWVGASHHAGVKTGVERERSAWEAKVAKAQAETARREVRAAEISDAAHADNAHAQTEIVTRYQTIHEKVPVYVTREADHRCVVPLGAIRLFNEAAAASPSEVPRSPGGPDDAATDVALSTLLGRTAENFGIAYSWRQEALTWRAWYVAQKKAWDK